MGAKRIFHGFCRSKVCVLCVVLCLGTALLVLGLRSLRQAGSKLVIEVTTLPSSTVLRLPPKPVLSRVAGDIHLVNLFVPVENWGCKFYFPFHVPGYGTSRICTYDPRVDTMISGFISRTGSWEMELIRPTLSLMHKDPLKIGVSGVLEPDISLLDLGSNIGVFTMSAALVGYNVLAVDAMYMSLMLLYSSLRLANLTSRVTLVHNAISDKHETVSMKIDMQNVGGSFVIHGISNSTNSSVVEAICLDDLLPYVPTRRVFVKMDIEVSEWLALKCADRFFAELDIRYFVMEWMAYKREEHFEKGQTILRYMTKQGYRSFHVTDPPFPMLLETNMSWPVNVLWMKAP